VSKLAEVFSKQPVIIDIYSVRKNHLLTLAFSLLIGFVYSLYLWLVCSTTPGVMSALLLFGSQIAIGIPATRAYYDLGVTNRENVHFIDPSKFSGGCLSHRVRFNLGEIPLIFEKMDLQINKYDKGNPDDLSDLAWFGIFVWAAFSSTTFFLKLSNYPLCLVGAIVFLIASFMSYISGYREKRNVDFEDDLSHLQFYLETRLKRINAILDEFEIEFYVELLERSRKTILVDFVAEVDIIKEATIVYHAGFPSDEPECITVEARTEILTPLFEHLVDSNILSTNGWTVEMIDTRAPPLLRISNQLSYFSVCHRSSYVTDPSLVAESSKTTAAIIREVANQFG
jgi:hypothetical protein